MNTFLNYFVEANLGLCVFLLAYVVLLKRETDFRLKRVFLLFSVAVSLIFPLIHVSLTESIVPSIGEYIPVSWLPEVVVQATGIAQSDSPSFNLWTSIELIYSIGVVAMLGLFLFRLGSLIKMICTSSSFRSDDLVIIESPENKSSFSFFTFVFIGQSNHLSHHEKELIIKHESVHVRQKHSIDMLLVNVLGVFFWFNPILPLYKKIFVQLHEFEADARAVENRDLNDYCSLLAKVALLSADFKLANHFSNSLTVKRIEMMRTLKTKISSWKVIATAAAFPCFFFVVACQDQVVNEMTEIARNSTNALLAPAVVQSRYEEVKKANPNSTYLMLELNDKAEKLLVEMEKAHGIPKSIELFTPDHGEYKKGTFNTGPDKISFNTSDEWERASKESDDLHTYAIMEYNPTVGQIADKAATGDGDRVYTVVEEAAEFPGGMEKLKEFLTTNLLYPEESRKMGLHGTVWVSFIVNKDGSITDPNVIKGIGELPDEAALKIVSQLPNWIPGKQDGQVVRCRFVLPIKFALN